MDGLRARADGGDEQAAWELADLLAARGDFWGADFILRARTDPDYNEGAWRAAEMRAEAQAAMLAERGDMDGLRAQADAGNGPAARQLADLLAARDDLDEAVQILQATADAGDVSAARRLAELLAERGDMDGLRSRIDAGDVSAAGSLVELLTKQNRGEEAERLRRFGLNPDGSIAGVLREPRVNSPAGPACGLIQAPRLGRAGAKAVESTGRQFGVQPGRVAARHRQHRQDGAAIGLTGPRRC